MTQCYLCGADTSKKSYFIRITTLPKKLRGYLVEVCPDCHHYFKYGTEEQKKDYILKKKIDVRGKII